MMIESHYFAWYNDFFCRRDLDDFWLLSEWGRVVGFVPERKVLDALENTILE